MPNQVYSEPNVFKTLTAKTVTIAETLSIWKPVAGKRFRLAGFDLTSSVTTTITLEDGGGVIYVTTLVANTPRQINFVNGGIPSSALNNELKLKTSVEGAITGTFSGSEE